MRSFISQACVAMLAAVPAALAQDIDLDMVAAAADPTYTMATGVTAQFVTYATPTLIAAISSDIGSVTVDVTDAATTAPNAKRTLAERAACATQPTGASGAPTVSPDSPSAFLANTDIAAAATNAPTPSGYTQTFQNLQGSNNALGYLGYMTMNTYDTAKCAAKCNTINGCMSVNVYFERDPSVDPGSGASGCANPPSYTMIKCVFWGGPVGPDNAVNTGQWRNQFQVVIAGSNGYMNNSIVPIPGYSAPVYFGNAAINAPYDAYGYNTFMGSQIFTSGPFDAGLCAKACDLQTQYNTQHPPTDGSPVQTCQFFNTYILYLNSTANLQGQYCALYSETWSSQYATNTGQYRGNDHYMIEYSYGYSNKANPGAACANCAVHQASKEIAYSTLQPYCSSLLGYSATTATATVSAYTTPVVTLTDVVGVTVTVTAGQQKRALSTPAGLTKYPGAIITSACSLQATKPTGPATTNTVTVTIIAASSTTIATSTLTATTTVAASTPGPLACGTNPTCDSGHPCNKPTGANGGGCYCYQTAEGGSACSTSPSCGSQTCSKNSDCSAGYACFVTCCGTTCQPYDNTCANTASPKRLFKKGSRIMQARQDATVETAKQADDANHNFKQPVSS